MKEEVKYRFGEILRNIREKRQMTMKEVASAAGLSESLISQIETNKVSPSLDTLLHLADILGIDPEYLFRGLKKDPGVTIVRCADRKTLTQPGLAFHQLSSIKDSSTEHAVEAYLLEIEPGAQKGSEEYGHIGRELGVILEGNGVFHYGNSDYELDTGDTVSFASDVPHVMRNTGKKKLKAVWIITPPKRMFS
jgi:transcriptional regulator with XRE-family HTH domain